MKRLNVLLPLAVCGLVLSGCSGDDGKKAGEAPDSASTSAGSVDASTEPAPEGAIADLTGKCQPQGRNWTFKGALNNTTKKPATYHVTISVVTKQGSTVQASADEKFKVAAGKKQQITLGPVKAKAKADSLACVPTVTVERG